MFGHAAILPYLELRLKDWGAIVLARVIALIAIVYVWFAVSPWLVEDRIPGNRTLIALIGAVIATAFAVVSVVNYLCERPKVKLSRSLWDHRRVRPTRWLRTGWFRCHRIATGLCCRFQANPGASLRLYDLQERM